MDRQMHLACIVFTLLLLAFAADTDADKTRRRGGSSSWGWNSKSRTTPKSKPQQHQTQGGSNTGNIGWNVPSNQKSASGTGYNPKPSAPSNEHVNKATATNVHSSYPYSNTASHANPPPYSATGQTGHNPSGGGYFGQPYGSSGGYHGQSYNSAGNYHGQPFNPSNYNPYGNVGHSYSNSPGQGYNPSYGHSPFSGSSGFGSQPQTVIVQSKPSSPGIGQIAKEAFVYAGVSAGVNAAVNRILPGGIYGHSNFGSSSSSSNNNGVVPPVSHTQITYNNYYNNGTGDGSASAAAPAAAPAPSPAATGVAAPATAPAAPAATSTNVQPNQAAPQNNVQQQPPPDQSPTGFIVTDAVLQKLTEDLYSKDTNNAFQHITIKLQGQKTDDSTTDDAVENLLDVKPEAYEYPTIKAVLALHDNYELDVKTKEIITPEERKEESDLLDAFIATDVMKATMKFLSDKGYIPNDEYEFKDSLKRIWFSQFKRIDGEPSSSGFETIFLAEKFDNEIIGLHNWIYFAKQEEAKKINYLGYIKKLDLGSNGAVIKGRTKLNDIVQPITTILVGTSPELEMALYTLCFYTRPNSACPVTMGGANFLIVATRVNYFGKDILISAYPDI